MFLLDNISYYKNYRNNTKLHLMYRFCIVKLQFCVAKATKIEKKTKRIACSYTAAHIIISIVTENHCS